MILDAKGKTINKKMKMGQLIIFISRDGGETWQPMMPSEVPQWVRHPDILGEMMIGNMATDPNKGPEWYRAEHLEIH